MWQFVMVYGYKGHYVPQSLADLLAWDLLDRAADDPEIEAEPEVGIDEPRLKAFVDLPGMGFDRDWET